MVEQKPSTARSALKGPNMWTISSMKPQIRVCSLSLLIGRNRMLVLNIFKFIAHRRYALNQIGQLSKKYASFVK